MSQQAFIHHCLKALITIASLMPGSLIHAQQAIPTDFSSRFQAELPAFKVNLGQFVDQNGQNTHVLYGLHLPGLNVGLYKEGFSYTTYRNLMGTDSLLAQRIDIDFPGSNLDQIIALDPSTQKEFRYTNYCPHGLEINSFHRVVYKNLYPNIDLELIAGKSTTKPFEYNFILHAGADPETIRIRYSGKSLNLNDGKIVSSMDGVTLQEDIPASWIEQTGASIDVQYKLISQTAKELVLGLKTDIIPETGTVIIDPAPQLTWGSYFGGNADEQTVAITGDTFGNIYIIGNTNSNNLLITQNAFQSTLAGDYDVFIAKFNARGSRIWTTYIGGIRRDLASGIISDDSGYFAICGTTHNNGVFNSAGPILSGSNDAFLARFRPDGTRIWGRVFGANAGDEGKGITRDIRGNLYISGMSSPVHATTTGGLATPGAHQVSRPLFTAPFLASFDSKGNRRWSTYIYGNAAGYSVIGIASDTGSGIYICGNTNATSGISTSGAHKTTVEGSDGFIVRFDTTGRRIWGTYFGGAGTEDLKGMHVADTSIYITGYAGNVGGIANGRGFKSTNAGGRDAYLAKFNLQGRYIWGTFYGGPAADEGIGVSSDQNRDVYLLCNTNSDQNSENQIATTGAHMTRLGSGTKSLIVKFNANGSRVWGTYYGSNANDNPTGIYCNKSKQVFITGFTAGTSGLATFQSFQTANRGGNDAFIASFQESDSRAEIRLQNGTLGSPKTVTSIEYGDIPISADTARQSIAICNRGKGLLQIQDITLSGEQAQSFRIVRRPANLIPSVDFSNELAWMGGDARSCDNLTVAFKSTRTGTHNATITIKSNDPQNPVIVIPIRAVSTASKQEIEVRGNSAFIRSFSTTTSTNNGTEFPPVSASQTNRTADRVYFIHNLGTDNLNLTGSPAIRIDQPSSKSVFRILESPSGSIPPGDSLPFTIRFEPTGDRPDTFYGTVSILNNDDDENPYRFRVRGIITTPILEFSIQPIPQFPASLQLQTDGTPLIDFGRYDISIALPRTFVALKNIGNEPAYFQAGINKISINGPDSGFYISQSGEFKSFTILSPNAVQVFEIRFFNQLSGLYQSTGRIKAINMKSPAIFRVHGVKFTSKPDIFIKVVRNNLYINKPNYGEERIENYERMADRPNNIQGTQFGFFQSGEGPQSKKIYIYNRGDAPLQIPENGISLISNQGTFQLITSFQGSILPYDSAFLDVLFNPSTIGIHRATISIRSNDPDQPSISFQLESIVTGNGTDMRISGNGITLDERLLSSASTSKSDSTVFTFESTGRVRTFVIHNLSSSNDMTIGDREINVLGTAKGLITLIPTNTRLSIRVIEYPDRTIPPLGSTSFKVRCDRVAWTRPLTRQLVSRVNVPYSFNSRTVQYKQFLLGAE